MRIALDPYMLRRVPLLELSKLVAEDSARVNLEKVNQFLGLS